MFNRPASQKSNPTSDDYVTQDSWGTDPPPDDSEVLRPLRPKVDVLPYRGQEYHGVDPNLAGPPPDINENVFDGTMQVPVKQEKPDEFMRPVPVRIVKNNDQWETTQFRTTQAPVGPIPVRVANHMKARTSLIVKNDAAAGTAGIYISSEQNPAAPNSFLLSPQQQLTINGTNAVYAMSADASTSNLSIYHEYYIAASKLPDA